MRIIIFGAGALGSLFAGLLSVRNEVYMVGREKHVNTVNSEGLTAEGHTKGVFRPMAGTSLTDSPFYPNWIILTVKAYHTGEAGKEILDTFPNVPVLSFQNGLENETVLKNMGLDAIGGVTSHGVTYLGPGKIRHAGEGKTAIGELDGRLSMRVRALSYVLSEAGISTDVTDNIVGEIWLKGAVNAVINPITAILGIRNGLMIELNALKELGNAIAGECGRISEANEILLPRNPEEEWRKVAEKTKDNLSSALQAINNGKRTEVREINGTFVRKAMEKNMDAPYNRFLLKMVEGKESLI